MCRQYPLARHVQSEGGEVEAVEREVRIVFAVNVLLRVGSLVFRMGALPDTFTVVVAAPTCSVTLSVAVWTASSENAGSVALLNPAAVTVTS